MRKLMIVLSLAALPLLAGCGSGATGASRQPTSSPTSVPTIAPTATATGQVVSPINAGIELHDCIISDGIQAKCGTYTVYEDRQSRTGRTIDLRVAVVKAKEANPAPDPVVYLAGGPGGSAVASFVGIGDAYRALNRRHDWLLVDQRGTGGSNMLTYPPPPPGVANAKSVEELEALLKPFVAESLKGLKGDIRFYTTSVAVDDIDEVAQALGYKQVNLYGGSYGATTVQFYLRQHGDHVRTAIMDGGTMLDVPIFEHIASNGQRALDLVFKRCEGDEQCAAAYPQLRNEMQSTYERLAKQPVTIDLVTDPLTGAPLVITRDVFAEVVRQQLLSASAAAGLPRLVHQAYTGDYSVLVQPYMRYAVQAGQSSRLAMYSIIRCSEAWAMTRPEEVARYGEGTYFLGNQVSLTAQLASVCKLLPAGVVPPDDGERVRSDVPVLILNGEADPQDPPENVAEAHKTLPNSLQLVVPGQGHGVIQYGCMGTLSAQFVDKGTTSGLDTSCVRDVPIPAFDTTGR